MDQLLKQDSKEMVPSKEHHQDSGHDQDGDQQLSSSKPRKGNPSLDEVRFLGPTVVQVAVKGVAPLTFDPKGHVRRAGLDTLCQIAERGDDQVLRLAEKRLEDEEEEVREAACLVLGNVAWRGDRARIRLLQHRSLVDRVAEVRRAGMYALEKLAVVGDAGTLRLLDKNLRRRHLDVAERRAALNTMRELIPMQFLAQRKDSARKDSALEIAEDGTFRVPLDWRKGVGDGAGEDEFEDETVSSAAANTHTPKGPRSDYDDDEGESWDSQESVDSTRSWTDDELVDEDEDYSLEENEEKGTGEEIQEEILPMAHEKNDESETDESPMKSTGPRGVTFRTTPHSSRDTAAAEPIPMESPPPRRMVRSLSGTLGPRASGGQQG